MKMPNLASVNQAGVGRLSMESQVGWYVCALAASAATTSSRQNGFIDGTISFSLQFRTYGPDGLREPAVETSNFGPGNDVADRIDIAMHAGTATRFQNQGAQQRRLHGHMVLPQDETWTGPCY